MKIAYTIIRILLGALFVFSAVAYFFNLVPQPELTGDMKLFNDGLNASGYLMPLVKLTELVCGLTFIIGRFVPLGTVIIFPVVVNILAVHLLLAPEGLPIALFVLAATLFLAYYNRTHFQCLLVSK